MVYPCPNCKTRLNIKPEHIGLCIRCPNCGESFIPEDAPVATIAEPAPAQKSGSSFGNVFKIVLYVLLALIIISAILFGARLALELATPNSIEAKLKAAEQAASGTETIEVIE